MPDVLELSLTEKIAKVAMKFPQKEQKKILSELEQRAILFKVKIMASRQRAKGITLTKAFEATDKAVKQVRHETKKAKKVCH